jgi:hypothetical protein
LPDSEAVFSLTLLAEAKAISDPEKKADKAIRIKSDITDHKSMMYNQLPVC